MYLKTILPCTYINYVVSGMPIFNALWPASENIMVSLMTVSNDLVTSPIYFILVGIYQVRQNNKERIANGLEPEKFSFKIVGSILLNLIKSPVLLGNIFGIVYAAIPIGYPLFLKYLLQFCGDLVLSLSLICVGNFLAQHSLISCNWIQFIYCLIVRFLIGPAIAGLFCYAIGMNPRLSRQCIIIGAQPTAVGSYMLTANSNLGQGVASTLVCWTIILSAYE